MASVLTEDQHELLNSKIATLSEEFHAILDKHGLSDLKMNTYHFEPRDGIRGCTRRDGQPGKLVCDRNTGVCKCV